MKYIPGAMEKYIESHSSTESGLLKRLRRETHLKTLLPQMISGHIQGRLLSMLSFIMKPRRILEIGTFTGYSAICLAEGLQSGGVLHSIDINEESGVLAQKYINESGMKERITLHHGNAMMIVKEIDETFDIVFIDADKNNYRNYFDLVIDKVRGGGIIIADNVLWSGKVFEEDKDKDTQAIDAFNKKVKADGRVDNIILGVSDGLMIARKIER